MKNVIILGLLALVLFSVSATLSLYLNQPKAGEETATKEKATAHKAGAREKGKAGDDAAEAEPLTPVVRPKPHAGTDEVSQLSVQLREQLAAIKDKEGRLDRRQAQLDIVLGDIRAERQAIDNLRKQVSAELKLVTDKVAELERRASDLEQQKQAQPKAPAESPRKTTEPDEGERKNLDKMAVINDSVPAERAAQIIQQLADTGKLDTAVQMLSRMKQRNAANVFAEIKDVDLAAQILDKMRSLKPAPAAAPKTGG